MTGPVASRRAAAVVLGVVALAVASLVAGPAATADPGGSGHGGGHGTTTSTSSSTSTSTSTSTPETTTSTTLPNACAGTFGCSLTSHGGAVAWSSEGYPGYSLTVELIRDRVTIATSSDHVGTFDTDAGDVVTARADYCHVLPPVGFCRDYRWPSAGGIVVITNP